MGFCVVELDPLSMNSNRFAFPPCFHVQVLNLVPGGPCKRDDLTAQLQRRIAKHLLQPITQNYLKPPMLRHPKLESSEAPNNSGSSMGLEVSGSGLLSSPPPRACGYGNLGSKAVKPPATRDFNGLGQQVGSSMGLGFQV